MRAASTNHRQRLSQWSLRLEYATNCGTRGPDNHRVSDSLHLIPEFQIRPVVLWCNCSALPSVVPKYNCTCLLLFGQNQQNNWRAAPPHYSRELGPQLYCDALTHWVSSRLR